VTQPQSIRNIAIIAHVDHGKTTLVDGMLRQSGTFAAHQHIQERVMDSMDLERERGITIAAKNASMIYKNCRINIVDTPGHADFGGEVERSLSMVDGAILLVDAAEGCLPQTRFVLQKALARDLHMIVVINKIDRPDARVKEVEEEIHDLFLDLSTEDHHLDFPTLYASGRQGWASKSLDVRTESLRDLFDTVLDHVPQPNVGSATDPLQLLVSNIAYNPYVGRLAIGRIQRGTIKPNTDITLMKTGGMTVTGKVVSVRAYRGLEQTELPGVHAGDIAIVAIGATEINIGDTIVDPTAQEALPRIEVDPPTVSVEVSVNTSPFAGKEGQYLTSRKLLEFLQREALYNVSLGFEETSSPEVFIFKARGELQVSIVMEKLRREGGECMVGRPRVILREIDGVLCEPIEHVVIDTPDVSIGIITEKLAVRKGRMTNMHAFPNGRSRVEFDVPSRGMLGYRNQFLTDTRGEGLMSSYLKGYEPAKTAFVNRKNGAMVADRPGRATEYALHNLEDRGRLFIRENEDVYEGMIVGEHARDNDLNVDAAREKKLTNIRAAGMDESTKLVAITKPSFETALEWVDDDEWIEVTPKNIRMRKRVLASNMRSVKRNRDE
jgi:GTP-binding protein